MTRPSLRRTPMRRRALLGLALLTAGPGLGPARAQKAQDTLRVAWRDATANLDFYFNNQRTGLIVSHHVWDTLVYRDPDTFQLKPLLATSWRNIDDTSIDFELRPNVRFHDGSRFGADDVLYTVDLVTRGNNLAVPSNYSFLAGAEKLDETRVRLKLRRVFPAALEYLAMVLPIYPREYRERVGPAQFSQTPVGTGPYRASRGDGTVGIDLERNEDYFDGPKGKPAIRRIAIYEVGDAASELAWLLNGQADWIWNFSADQLQMLATVPVLQVMTSESMRVGFVNMDAAGRTGADNPFTEQKVRQAVVHAVDRQAIARQFMPGGSRVLDAPCYPTQFGCDQAVAKRYDYDPAKARALLAEAGYKEGFETELVTYLLPQINQAMRRQWDAVGIRAKVNELQTETVTRLNAEGRSPMNAGSWGSYSINDVSAFLPYFFNFGVNDYARDPEVTRAVNEGGATADPDKRRAAYATAIRRISEQAYFMPLFTFVTTFAMRKELVFKPSRDELPRFYLASWR